MVPGYQAIYGRPCTLDDLIGLIKHFAVDDWLLHLSRLATLLAGPRHRPGSKYADAFFRYIVPERTHPRLASWFADAAARGATALIFHDRQVGILIELALLHAPSQASEKLGPEGQVLDALLMLTDLATPPQWPQTDEEIAAVLALLLDRSRLVDSIATITRGFHLYQIACPRLTLDARSWADLFKRATGPDLRTYFLGGLVLSVTEQVKSPEDLAGSFLPLPDSLRDGKGKSVRGVPDAYCAIRCAEVEQIKCAVQELEKDANPDEFNLVPLLKYPLFRNGHGKAHSLFLSGMAVSLCEGIYQEIITAAKDHAIPESCQHVGGVFGLLFEEYVLDLLEECFPHRVLKRPRRSDNGHEAADGAIICPEGVMVLQIKGRHVRATSRFAWKTHEAKEEDVKSTGLVDAVDQFVEKESLLSFRQGLVEGVGLPSPVLLPVAITYEAVPLSPSLLPIVKAQRARVRLDERTRPLVIMNVGEIEAACSLPPSDTIWGVLAEFMKSPGWQERHLTNFLYDTKRLSDKVLLSRWERIMPMLGERFGLDS